MHSGYVLDDACTRIVGKQWTFEFCVTRHVKSIHGKHMLSVMPAPIFILFHDWIVMNFIRDHFSMEGGTRQHVYGPVWISFLIPRDASRKMVDYTMSIASKNILGTQNYLVLILSHDKQH